MNFTVFGIVALYEESNWGRSGCACTPASGRAEASSTRLFDGLTEVRPFRRFVVRPFGRVVWCVENLAFCQNSVAGRAKKFIFKFLRKK